MRCPDCCKFTGLENQDPEVDNIEVEGFRDGFEIRISGRHVRACAECGGELKAVDFEEEFETPFSVFKDWNTLTPEQQKQFCEGLATGDITPEIEETGATVDESGGGRYAKNIITITVDWKLTVALPDGPELTHEGQSEIENAAGDYEEQV